MSLPSETDLPDPPLDNSGELLLTADLQLLADRLRRESVSIAESEVPQSAAAPLLEHAANRETRQTWRHIALGVATLTVCASFAAIAIILHEAAELARPIPGRAIPRLHGSAAPDEYGRLAPAADKSVFMSSSGNEADEQLETDLATAADSLTADQRIELVEKTLERYRSVLTANHERLQELEAELKQAKEQLAQRESRP